MANPPATTPEPTQNGTLKKDDNGYPVAGGVDSVTGLVRPLLIDNVTGRLLVTTA